MRAKDVSVEGECRLYLAFLSHSKKGALSYIFCHETLLAMCSIFSDIQSNLYLTIAFSSLLLSIEGSTNTLPSRGI